jgi:hypothetical protein
VNETNIIARGGRVLERRLPPGWTQKLAALRGTPQEADATLRIVSPDGVEALLAVEVKARLFPRDVPGLKRRLASIEARAGLVMTEFLTPSAKRRLVEEDLNYLDLTGNIRLALSRPGLFIATDGATTDPNPAEKGGRSLRGAKAGRVVRALCDFPPPLAVSDLAMKAGVDISYASRLLEWLAREGLLTRVSRGAVEAIDRARMIRRWADDYSVLKSNEARSFLDPRGLSNLLRRLPTSRVRYAVTGSLAANRLAPVAPARLAMVYLDDPDEAANDLNLTATDAGANVMLLAPFDDIVFERTRTDETVTYVAPSQAAVDLLTSPGRSPAEGEAVLEWMARNPPS